MKYNNFLIFLSLLFTLNLSAVSYEDGEDKKIERWETLAKSSSGTIRNVYDKSKKSRVIRFIGEGTKSAYILMINERKNKKFFEWEMKYSEDFVIFISLDTKLGKRYLIYTPGSRNGYMQYGLGFKSKSGTWQKYRRNLEEDLRYFDNRNTITKINSFVIRGSGAIDNIKLMQELRPHVKKEIEKKPLHLKKKPLKTKKKVHSGKRKVVKRKRKSLQTRKKSVKKKLIKRKKKNIKVRKKLNRVKKKSQKVKQRVVKSREKLSSKKHKVLKLQEKPLVNVDQNETDTTPNIIIKGENPYFIRVGETFHEPGVRAEDKEDGELAVTSSEYIDKHKDGKYVVIYMATDSKGNSAIDRRYVIVGEPGRSHDRQESNEVSYDERPAEAPVRDYRPEEPSEAQYQLEEQELEIAEWEKELQLREQELNRREKRLSR